VGLEQDYVIRSTTRLYEVRSPILISVKPARDPHVLFVKFVRQVSCFLQLLLSFVKSVRQVSVYLHLLRSFVKLVRQVNSAYLPDKHYK
jgi:hypothetical protein